MQNGAADAHSKDTPHWLRREVLAQLATVTGGLAPEPIIRAWWDWYLSLSSSPQTQAELARSACEKALDSWQFALSALRGSGEPAVAGDKRFADATWNQWPFNVYARSYKNWENWWREALDSATHADERSSQVLKFFGGQMIEAASPSHYLPTNPELLELTRVESGRNLIQGYRHWLEDVRRMLGREPVAGTEGFKVGRDVGVTPGKVVLRNELIELIQYSPQTPSVYAEPILITPAWIMKYYILDLSPRNSLVRYLVEQGHTVFMISWKNPVAADRNLGMDDYFRMGFCDALDAVATIVPNSRAHVVGYCIGGTLNIIGAAALLGKGDRRIASLSLFTSLADFSEPGEISVFIDPAQVAMLDAMMARKGVLEGPQMAAAFQLLRSYDLLWQPAVDTYVRGKRMQLNDLMSWNADATRMPWRMHTEYLRRLYLENDLVHGRFEVEGTRIDLRSIQVPVFSVGTETDHVAPWRAVYKTREYTGSPDFTFLLTSGGHNAGIVSGPQHPKRRYRMSTWRDATSIVSPEEWLAQSSITQGSWWPAWQQWLVDHSSGTRVPAPALGNPAEGYAATNDAPGEYVHQR
jgi:polyhydroxyalkanoate synthase subunit PhaC